MRCPGVRAWLVRAGTVVVGVLVATGLAVPLAPPAAAHPLGNFTVNTYSGLRVHPGGVAVELVVDMAELPAYQARTQQVDADRDGRVSAQETGAYAAASCSGLRRSVRVTADGRDVPVQVVDSALTFPPGAAGLETLRLVCTLEAPTKISDGTRLAYRSEVYADRVGWREVVAAGDGVTLVTSDVPERSVSKALTVYPEDLLSSPPDVRAAALSVRPGGSARGADGGAGVAAGSASRGVDPLTRAFTDFVGRPRLTLTLGLLAVLAAVVLGSLHAFAPGHGKTVMAAVLVGERGSLRQAGVIAATVTVTHTAGVLVLGVVLTTSAVLAPQRLYAWLAVASGLLLAAVGTTLLARAWRAARRPGADRAERVLAAVGGGHTHSHGLGGHEHGGHGHSGHEHGGQGHGHAPAGHDHDHDHGGHGHGHDGHGHDHVPAGHGHDHDGHGHDHVPAGHGHDHDGHDRDGHGDDHVPAGHGHDHDGHNHPHDEAHDSARPHLPAPPPPLGRRGLVAMGFAGGLVPSPSAIVVLLGAVALGRTWFGILLVIGYGLGMAGTLTGVGLLLARSRGVLERRGLGRLGGRVRILLPLATAGIIVVVGAGLALQAAAVLVGA